MNGLGLRFEQALAEAAAVHRHQRRRASATPYVAHLLAVAALVLEHGGDDDQAIAALFHDAVEDHGVDPGALADRYGPGVAAIVVDCTDTLADDPARDGTTWRRRKEHTLARIDEMADASRLVLFADKLHNLRSLLADLRAFGPAVWERFHAGRDDVMWYHGAIVAAAERGGPGALADELARTLAAIDDASR